MLPRTHLLFTRLDMSQVPLRQRRTALALELEQQAPFEQPRGWVIWQGALAGVWYWPESLEQAIASKNQLVPETALWPLAAGEWRWVQDQGKALFLLQYHHPRKGLQEKRYTSPVSEAQAQGWFTRHGLSGEAVAHLHPQPRPEPANELWGESLSARDDALERRWLPALGALLVLLALAYGVAIGRAWWATEQLRAEHQALEPQVADVMAERQRARALDGHNREMLERLNRPSQLQLAERLAQVLDVEGGRLSRWHYRAGRLELSWAPEGALPEATDIIRRLERQPGFTGVEAEIRGGEIVELSLDISADALTGGVPDA